MVTADLLDRLRRALAAPMAAEVPPPGRRRAAVLVLVDPAAEGLPLLFLVRSDHLRNHAGQIAFPGGSTEPGDPDLVATALREAAEEVGLDPGGVEVLGALPSRLTRRSDLWLTPIVAQLTRPFQVRGDGYEVADWFWLPLTALLSSDHRAEQWSDAGEPRTVHFYEVEGRTVWGVTGAIVHDLLERLAAAG